MSKLTHEFIQELRSQLNSLDIDDLKRRISKRMNGRKVGAPNLPSGTFVYRARRIDDSFLPSNGVTLRDLSYPPASQCRAGRLNRPGSPLFYCSTSKSPLLFELGALPGEEFVCSIWKMNQSPILTSLGYTNSVFQSLGAKREAPVYLPRREDSPPDVTTDILSELFAEKFSSDGPDRYKLTAAIAELHYDRLGGNVGQFAGVIYPSVAMWANGDNIALRPWFVDSHLQWTKALHIQVEAATETSFSIKDIDCARSITSDGLLEWAGHTGTTLGTPGPFEFLFAKGPDEVGDYLHGKDGIVGHWQGTDLATGKIFLV